MRVDFTRPAQNWQFYLVSARSKNQTKRYFPLENKILDKMPKVDENFTFFPFSFNSILVQPKFFALHKVFTRKNSELNSRLHLINYIRDGETSQVFMHQAIDFYGSDSPSQTEHSNFISLVSLPATNTNQLLKGKKARISIINHYRSF